MRSPRALLCCLAALPVAMALAGCTPAGSVTTTGYTGQSADVAHTISNFDSDASSRNTSKLCGDDLSSRLVRALSVRGHSCESVMSEQLMQVDDESLAIERISVDGDKASAIVKDINAGKDHLDTLKLVKQGKDWKIDGLG